MTNWIICKSLPDYEVNSNGNIRVKKTRVHVRASPDRNKGTRVVSVKVDGKWVCRQLNRIIYETFVGSLKGLNGKERRLDHINEDRSDCRKENLRIRRRKERVPTRRVSVKRLPALGPKIILCQGYLFPTKYECASALGIDGSVLNERLDSPEWPSFQMLTKETLDVGNVDKKELLARMSAVMQPANIVRLEDMSEEEVKAMRLREAAWLAAQAIRKREGIQHLLNERALSRRTSP